VESHGLGVVLPKHLDNNLQQCKITSMNKLAATLLILFVLFIVSFGTWQLFLGNLEAAFSSFFFLMIIYLFVKPLRK